MLALISKGGFTPVISKTKQPGFTIVELLIVIVVIGILATLVITAFTGVQRKARDTKRITDIKALHAQVEAFYAQKTYYPSLTDMNNATWRTANIKVLDSTALQDPNGSSQTLYTTTTATQYQYNPLNSGGTSCEADDTTCSTYTLTATLESGGIVQKTALN